MVQETKRTVFISAAETSGDHHAARLVREILKQHPDWRCVGIGGPAMARAGCHLLEDVTARSAMLAHALGQVGFYWKLLGRVKDYFKNERPDVVVVVDSPAWNFHVAKAARKNGVAVLHYIAPQLWAWGAWRVNKLRRLTDHVACILPFEPEWFKQHNIPATYVGHPLFDDDLATPAPPPVTLPEQHHLTLALLPGSRMHEVEKLWPLMQHTAAALLPQFPGLRFRAAAASDTIKQYLDAHTNPALNIEVRTGGVEPAVRYADLALVASGTATLQVAAQGCPMIVVYHVPWLQWNLIGRWLIKTPHISLVNIIAKSQVIPEYIISRKTSKNVQKHAENLLKNAEIRDKMRADVQKSIIPILTPGASARAAKLIENLMPSY